MQKSSIKVKGLYLFFQVHWKHSCGKIFYRLALLWKCKVVIQMARVLLYSWSVFRLSNYNGKTYIPQVFSVQNLFHIVCTNSVIPEIRILVWVTSRVRAFLSEFLEAQSKFFLKEEICTFVCFIHGILISIIFDT